MVVVGSICFLKEESVGRGRERAEIDNEQTEVGSSLGGNRKGTQEERPGITKRGDGRTKRNVRIFLLVFGVLSLAVVSCISFLKQEKKREKMGCGCRTGERIFFFRF